MPDASYEFQPRPEIRGRKRRKDARPQEILDAALGVFAKRGFAATRIEDIAAAAGVSKGVIYLYFDSKVALLEALIRNGVLPNVQRLESIAERSDLSAVEMLRAVFAFVQHRFEHSELPMLPRIVLAEAVNYPQFATLYRTEVIDRIAGAFARIIDLGIARGEFRPLSTHEAARVLLMPMWAIVFRRSLYDTGFEPIRLLEIHLDLFLQGALVRTSEQAAAPIGGRGAGPVMR